MPAFFAPPAWMRQLGRLDSASLRPADASACGLRQLDEPAELQVPATFKPGADRKKPHAQSRPCSFSASRLPALSLLQVTNQVWVA